MLESVRDSGGRLIYRPIFARGLVVVFGAVGLWWDADLVLRGEFAPAALGLLWLVAVCSGLAALFWRPAVIVDDEGAQLRNVLRDVRIPWAALDAVETRYALTLVAAGRRYVSWAGASGGRPPRRRPGDPGVPESGPASRHLGTASGATAFLVEQKWQAWRAAARDSDGDPPAVVVRWRLHLLAAAGAAAALAALLTPALG
ncbi:MAG TPA: PH domain-containing protein [Kineosporiaceae bacterium]